MSAGGAVTPRLCAVVVGAFPAGVRMRIDALRHKVGPPWAEDEKPAALAAWIALARTASTA